MKRSIKILAAFLAVALLFRLAVDPVFGTEEESLPLYVSEVKIFTAATGSEARKACKEEGYLCYEQDLNAGTGGNAVYLGYKLTPDESKAITDIEMLQMDEGYEERDYSVVARSAMEKMGAVTSEFRYAASEFAANLAAGSPAATVAKQMLDLLTIPECDGKTLGEYLSDGSYSQEMLEKIFVQSASAVINILYNCMTGAVADPTENNWASRVDNTVVMDLETGDNTSELDAKYRDLAVEIADQVITFSQNCIKALQQTTAHGEAAGTEVSVSQMNAEIAELDTEENPDPDDAGYVYLMAYEILNRYTYDGETPLGEWLVEAGQENSFATTAELRTLYPLVEALTRGQIAVMRITGIPQMALFLENDAAIVDSSAEMIADAREKVRDYCGADSMSVWEGVDQTIFEQKIAMTSSAVRSSSAGQFIDTYVKSGEYDETFTLVMTYLSIASGAISVVWGLSVIGFSIYVGTFSMSAASMAAAMVSSGALSTIISIIGVTLNVLSMACLVITVIVLIVWFIWYLVDELSEDDDETYSRIPAAIYDYRDGDYILYDLTPSNGTDGFGADLNGGKDQGKRWNALYYSRSSLNGEPIAADEEGNVFLVRYGSSAVPAGYRAVTTFGEVSPANTNANARRDDKGGCFLFCRTASAPAGGEETGDQEKEEATTSTYISDLLVSCRENETYAKSELTAKGFNVIDVNLTPRCRKYTYVGYKTSTNPAAALTDIRILPNSAIAEAQYGMASYTSCGTTAAGDTVYYTMSSAAGTPILSLAVFKDRDSAGKGWEPLNLFSGGPGFNLNRVWSSSSLSVSSNKGADEDRYLFFEPSVKYTEGEEYLSGIVLIAGQKASDDRNSLEKYIAELGFTAIGDSNLTEDYIPGVDFDNFTQKYDYLRPVTTRICYSTTYNPYRAVYGIGSYTGEPKVQSLPAFLGSTASGGAYAACTVYYNCLGGTSAAREVPAKELPKGIYASNSYFNFSGYDISNTGSNPEYFEDYGWVQSYYVRLKDLYVLGKTDGKTPLTVDDIRFSREAEAPDGFTSVQDLRVRNSEALNNLAYHFDKYEYRETITTAPTPVKVDSTGTEQYLFVRGNAVRPTYISSISVSSIKPDEEDALSSDSCFAYLLATCTDEIKMVNLAAKEEDSFNGDSWDYTNVCAYVGVSRTDKESAAITGVIKYAPADGKAPESITVDGVPYTRAGVTQEDSVINDPSGRYWLYYTRSAGAKPGAPVTDLIFDHTGIISGAATVLTATSSTGLSADMNDVFFAHCAYDTELGYIQALYVGHGNTENAAMADLLSMGCTQALLLNLNNGAGGEKVYLGYSKYIPELSDANAKYAVRDILLTTGTPAQTSMTWNGAKYYRAIDSSGSAVSLNAGIDGAEDIYVYYTTASVSGAQSPITHIAAVTGDGAPDFSRVNWEYLLTQNGVRCNVNGSVLSVSGDGRYVRDCRLYLFASRKNNTPKPEGIVKYGTASPVKEIGELYTNDK